MCICLAEYFYFHVKCSTKAANLTENAFHGLQSYGNLFKNRKVVSIDTFQELHCEYIRENINKSCVIHIFTENANLHAAATISKNTQTQKPQKTIAYKLIAESKKNRVERDALKRKNTIGINAAVNERDNGTTTSDALNEIVSNTLTWCDRISLQKHLY